MENILFAYLKIQQFPLGNIIQEIENLPIENWFYDTYRTVHMLPIYTQNGTVEKNEATGKVGSMEWTKYTPISLREYLTKNIFDWMNPPGRVFILRTPPGNSSSPHIDCRKEDYLTSQYKLRIALQGAVSSLYFLTSGRSVSPEDSLAGTPFIIDGRWPHGMKNDSSKSKYTICIGAPWGGDGLSLSMINKNTKTLLTGQYSLPSNYENYFESMNSRKKKFGLI